MSTTAEEKELPCTLVVDIPFPTGRLANAALRTLSVDQELSPLVRRHFAVVEPTHAAPNAVGSDPFRASLLTGAAPEQSLAMPAQQDRESRASEDGKTILRTTYRATTNRMLRVSVNGFFESMAVVLQVMEELDTDVVHEKGLEGLERVQGVEQGMTGTTVTGG